MEMYQDYLAEMKAWLESLLLLSAERNIDTESDIHVELQKLVQKTKDLENGNPQREEILLLEEDAVLLHGKIEMYMKQQEVEFQRAAGSVPIGKHLLPALPYPYNALEPVISEEIMRLHHDKHHKAYVDGLNKAEMMMQKARSSNDFDLLKHWEREAAFHGSGHYLHTIFWEIMSPKGGGTPKGVLLDQIEKDFGSFEAFKRHFSEAAKQVEGVGWALLVWSPRARRLEILQTELHMILTQWDTIPLLVLDVWEHAYYLQYKNNRGEYVDNWWKLINWPAVSNRFQKARQLNWPSA
ncbi:superoxide dismutase [Bacillus sp. M6-12]|uniref:superoxide dismutase n=1 Tax=Bacillus sp. M6-12 TaxID=2054166 RepID=UPI000C78E1B3|nr:superoxide dismutase [Bacillus sp. M6-12]